MCKCVGTILEREGEQAGDASDEHGETQSPSTSPSIHGGPQEEVGGQFRQSGQQEI